MGKGQILPVLSLVFSLPALCLATLAWRNRGSNRTAQPDASPGPAQSGASTSTPTPTSIMKSGHPAWLKGTSEEKFREVERHFRGTDIAMMEVGLSFCRTSSFSFPRSGSHRLGRLLHPKRPTGYRSDEVIN